MSVIGLALFGRASYFSQFAFIQPPFFYLLESIEPRCAHRLLACTQDAERANRLDDTSMTDRERALNSHLLNAATHIVGEPKQMSVKLY
jgi:hypothetical protein